MRTSSSDVHGHRGSGRTCTGPAAKDTEGRPPIPSCKKAVNRPEGRSSKQLPCDGFSPPRPATACPPGPEISRGSQHPLLGSSSSSLPLLLGLLIPASLTIKFHSTGTGDTRKLPRGTWVQFPILQPRLCVSALLKMLFYLLKICLIFELGTLKHAFNTSIQEAETGRSL